MSAAATRESTASSYFNPSIESDGVVLKRLTKASTSTNKLDPINKVSSAAVVGGILLYSLGYLHPITAGCAIILGALALKDDKTLYNEKAQAIADELIKSGLKPPIHCEQGLQLTIVSYDNPTTSLNEALDDKIEKLALELLDIQDGEAIYKRNETTIGVAFQFKSPIQKTK